MEKLIAFNKFDNEDAFLLGCNLVEKVKKENLKNIDELERVIENLLKIN